MMTEGENTAYEMGRRATAVARLDACIADLGYDDPDTAKAKWALERVAHGDIYDNDHHDHCERNTRQEHERSLRACENCRESRVILCFCWS